MNGENENQIPNFLDGFSGDARELNSVRSEEKWIFFPSWTGSSFFAQHSTDWEPAAMRKRNPPNPSDECVKKEYTVNREYFGRTERGGRGRERSRLNREKKVYS